MLFFLTLPYLCRRPRPSARRSSSVPRNTWRSTRAWSASLSASSMWYVLGMAFPSPSLHYLHLWCISLLHVHISCSTNSPGIFRPRLLATFMCLPRPSWHLSSAFVGALLRLFSSSCSGFFGLLVWCSLSLSFSLSPSLYLFVSSSFSFTLCIFILF